MAFELADQPINIERLTEEVAKLKPPEFEGISRLSRRENEDGAWEAVAPYILIRCGKMTAAREAKIRQALTAHDATPTPAPADPRIAKVDGMGVSDEDKATLKELFGLT